MTDPASAPRLPRNVVAQRASTSEEMRAEVVAEIVEAVREAGARIALSSTSEHGFGLVADFIERRERDREKGAPNA